MTNSKQKYDFVIVGSGMGGLTSGLILAKNGYKVLVLEKNHQIGGALQVFSRDKKIFDTGVHYLGGLDDGENLNTLFRYLEIYDNLKLKSLDRDCFDLIRFGDGESFKHGQGYENFINGLIESFPDESQAIHQFCDKLKEICDLFPLYHLDDSVSNAYTQDIEILTLGAWDYVSSITNNNRLRNVFLGSGPLYAGDAKSTPMYVVALIMNSYIKGSYRLVDGGSQIAKEIVKKIRENGGEVLKRKEVVSASYGEDRKITSVECSDGSRYEAESFISNMHPDPTIDIFGKEKFRKAYRTRINSLENTVSSFVVYISLTENQVPYLNYNVYDYFVEDTWETVDYNKETWPQWIYVSTPATSKSNDFTDSLSIMCYMNTNEFEEWSKSENTVAKPMDRGEAYELFKKEKEKLVIERLKERFPDIEKSIRSVYSSSPLTYKDYLATPEGSLYGIMKDINKPVATIINTKTKIPNLFLTGQNVLFHGIVGTAIGSLVTCFNFVDFDVLMKKIKKYER